MILGWLFVLVSLGMAYVFFSQREVKAADLIEKTGVLAEDPLLVKDEYQENVGIRLTMEGEKVAFSVPGKLLQTADSAILALKGGDTVRYFVKQPKAFTLVDRFLSQRLRVVFGLSSADRQLYTVETGIQHFTQPMNSVWAALFLILGLALAVFLWRS